jgi:hypothetical protein
MTDLFNIKSPNWLGGTAIISTVTLIGVGYLVYKTYKK